jgi:hypothetical protein
MGIVFAFLIFVKHRNGSYMFEMNDLQLCFLFIKNKNNVQFFYIPKWFVCGYIYICLYIYI